jgi:hypothetical protein
VGNVKKEYSPTTYSKLLELQKAQQKYMTTSGQTHHNHRNSSRICHDVADRKEQVDDCDYIDSGENIDKGTTLIPGINNFIE